MAMGAIGPKELLGSPCQDCQWSARQKLNSVQLRQCPYAGHLQQVPGPLFVGILDRAFPIVILSVHSLVLVLERSMHLVLGHAYCLCSLCLPNA